jgi:hypothetical protein
MSHRGIAVSLSVLNCILGVSEPYSGFIGRRHPSWWGAAHQPLTQSHCRTCHCCAAICNRLSVSLFGAGPLHAAKSHQTPSKSHSVFPLCCVGVSFCRCGATLCVRAPPPLLGAAAAAAAAVRARVRMRGCRKRRAPLHSKLNLIIDTNVFVQFINSR